MTTALTLITDALIEIGAHDLGQTVPAEDAALGLRYLNRIMERWSNSPGLFPVLPEISVPMSGAASYTIGPTGDVVSTRPLRIDRATFVLGEVEYPVNVLSRQEWDAIAVKNVTGSPVSDVWFDASVTNARIYTYPIADTGTLKLDAPTLLTTFASTSTTLTLPVGYESAIVLTLASDIAGAFQRPVTPDLRARAAGAVRVLKRMNSEPLLVSVGIVGEQDFEVQRGY
jgi:hypothetical protein